MNDNLRKDVISEKRKTSMKDPNFNVAWEGKPNGLGGRILNMLHMNFTTYKITNDELVVQKGFFIRRTNTVELYLLKDPDLREGLIQRLFKVGTIFVTVDGESEKAPEGKRVVILKDISEPEKVRKLLRDYIEADVMERGITYFDRV